MAVLVRSSLRELLLAQGSGIPPGHGGCLRCSRASSRSSVSLFYPLCKSLFSSLLISLALIDKLVPNRRVGLSMRVISRRHALVVAQTNANGDLSDPVVIAIYKEIVDTLEWEKKEGHTMSPMEMFKTPVARKRLLIGMSPGLFSCIAGNIIASYYLGSELDTAGITDTLDQLKAVRLPTYEFKLTSH